MVDDNALALALDVETLLGVMEQLAVTDPRRHEILRALEREPRHLRSAGDTLPARAALAEAMTRTGVPHGAQDLGCRARSH